MYTLYYSSGTCSLAVHVLLKELAVPHEIKNANAPDGKRTAEFSALGKRTSVPVLVEDGTIIREGGAMLTYLMDKHNSPMLPKNGLARAKALEWLMFANATLHPAYSRVFFLLRNMPDSEAKQQVLKAAIDSINALWAEVNGELETRPYICGDQCTAADILLTVISHWGRQTFPHPVALGANVERLVAEIVARPAYQEALQAEKAA
jgi:glutathione S-transferase